jgi:biotin carboxyl carrier protein
LSGPEGTGTERLPDAAALDRLADELLPPLIAHFNASGLGELEVRRGDWRVRLRAPAGGRNPGAAEAAATPAGRKAARTPGGLVDAAAARPASGNGQTPAEPATGRDRPADGPAGRTSPERDTAMSPGVGYFTARDGLAAGTAVRSGDVLGHIDVLGVRVEVVAPAEGIVARLLADAGEAVEYGQALVRLDRSSSTATVRES